MSDNECTIDEKIGRIKYGIISKIFYAGSRWRHEAQELESAGKYDAKAQQEHCNESVNIIVTYWDVVDLIWGEFPEDEDVCGDCQLLQDREEKELTDEEVKQIKEQMNPKINPN